MEENDRVTEPAAEPAEAPAADPAALLASLAAERDELARQRDEYYDRLLRRTADLDNFRRRAERERSEMLEFAGMEAARELLPVLDDFELALKVECADAKYAKGMGLIYQRLLDTLKKLGLEPMEAQGARFDPHIHHAVETVQTEEVEDHTIVEELRHGYNFKGRLLRPALVKVAVRQ